MIKLTSDCEIEIKENEMKFVLKVPEFRGGRREFLIQASTEEDVNFFTKFADFLLDFGLKKVVHLVERLDENDSELYR